MNILPASSDSWRPARWRPRALVVPYAQQPAAAPPVVDSWRYTVQKPADGWEQPAFDDGEWLQGRGGFGTLETPGARVGTVWTTANIWLRKSFTLADVPRRPALLVHHDEDAEVFINGRKVAAFERWATDYAVVPLDETHRAALVAGRNVMAVHCRQTDGGQFIDVHLVDADRVPALPPAVRETRPFASDVDHQVGRGGDAGQRLDRVPAAAAGAGPVAEPERALGLRRHAGGSASAAHPVGRQDPRAVLAGVEARRRAAVARCHRSAVVPGGPSTPGRRPASACC